MIYFEVSQELQIPQKRNTPETWDWCQNVQKGRSRP